MVDTENALVVVTCRMCGKDHEITVPVQGFAKWHRGELIQNALPNLTPDERELLISRVCGPCYTELFPSED